MPGVTLSRWTMAYFAAALGALVAAEGLMALGYGFPADPIRAPESLILTHLVAIGWLSLLMCGALFQFVPVLVARPLHSDALPLPTLACLLAGLAALLLGFLGASGAALPDFPFLPAGAVLLGAGFGLAVWNLGRTLWAARPLPLPARFVAAGLLSLVATAALGAIFALALGGATAFPPFLELAAAGLPIHVIAGLGGWLTFTAIGVSYRLLAMFMLAPEPEGAASRATFYVGAAALAVAVLGGVGAICRGGERAPGQLAAGALGVAAVALYGRDVVQLYRRRRRRAIETNSRMAALALASLGATTILTVALLAVGRLDEHVGAVVFLAAFGWLTGLGLAKLYKIVAFLTWLECYGPVLGRTPTPRVQDLVVEPRAAKWFALYFAATWIGAAALVAGQATGFRIAAAAMAAATCGVVAQLVRARLLADVKPALRLPAGARRPRLLLSLPRRA